MRTFFCFIFISLSFSVSAQSLPSEYTLEKLANSTQWAHLLHYRTHPFSLRYQSQADSPNFFLAKEGKTSLLAELSAAIDAFMQTNQADNQSAQCRFPARYHWLKTALPEQGFIDQPCSELHNWQQTLDAHYLTLIFPASHINSPSSMYGHTFIRLDRADEKSNKLLAYSVNFAANADPEDNELVFSYKGLTGGYPGVVSVLPYFAKTNEYSHMEARDIWEYRLALDKTEVDQFVRHIWETKDIYFDYFFFDENCSYRLLALLDASSERLNSADDFLFTAMPVDTIRALKSRNFIRDINYRASSAAQMESRSAQAKDQVLRIAKNLVDSDEDIEASIASLSVQEQAQSLELAYAYARYLSVKKRQASPELRARTVAILSARAKRQQNSDFTEAPTPAYRDDEGHLSQRLNLKVGSLYDTDNNLSYLDLGYRIAFHEVMDLPKGLVAGSQIQMGNLGLRVWQHEGVQLNYFQVVDILSLSHDTYFQRPIAWSVSGGFERFIGPEAELYGYLKLGFGKAYLTQFGRFYGLAQAQLLADDQFTHDAQLNLGPRLGWLWQGEQLQFQLEGNYQAWSLIDDLQYAEIRASIGIGMTDNFQLRLDNKNQFIEEHNQNEISFGMSWYF